MSQATIEAKIKQQVVELAALCLKNTCRVATAESCTGGWIAKLMTDLPGSSRWFDCSFVSYSNTAKKKMLSVDDQLLLREGAVSEPVVRQMAMGAIQQSEANYTVAVSGIAGPDGGSPDKPVGTVWFAWASEGQPETTKKMCFTGDREAVRLQTVAEAMRGLIEQISKGNS